MKQVKWHLVIGCCVALLSFIAASKALLAAANVSISYTSAAYIPPNSLVSTLSSSSGSVELANIANQDHVIGVAVSTNQSLLAMNTSNNTQVAVSGVVAMSVSTFNGDIHAGDQISASSVDGVGMKIGQGLRAVGIAQSSLDSTSKDAATIAVDGRTVYLGHVTVSLANSNFNNNPTTPGVINFLQTVATKASGHQVTEIQAILSFVVALIAIVATTVLVYGAVRGGLISLGRNPLARMLIIHSIEELMALIPAIIIITAVVIYFILR